MTPRRAFNVGEDRLTRILQEPKHVLEGVVMQHAGGGTESTFRENLVYSSTSGDAMAGVSMQLRSVRAPAFVYHSFMLVYTHQRQQNIILQIEVEPAEKVSHREAGLVIHGPHCVTLNRTEAVREPGWNWFNWLSDFERRAGVSIFGDRIPPFNGELPL